MLAIDESALGPEHSGLASDLINLAGMYYVQGRYVEAESLMKRALAIDEKALGPTHFGLATDLENYAALLWRLGRVARATEMERRAAKARSFSVRALAVPASTRMRRGPAAAREDGQTTRTRWARTTLAWRSTSKLWGTWLAIFEKAMGPDHPSVATNLHNLAEQYHLQGRYTGALWPSWKSRPSLLART